MNLSCPQCQSSRFFKSGLYFRKNDSQFIQRYQCSLCRKRFSQSTSTLEYGQKKRRVNQPLRQLLCSGVSMRRCALILKIHQTTVKRKLVYLAQKARLSQGKFLSSYRDCPCEWIQMDDLITIEHTKLKPLAVSLVVDAQRRAILALGVSQIPAFGLLAHKSRRKYGKRKSEHLKVFQRVLDAVSPFISPHALVQSDKHKHYPKLLSQCFPSGITHQRFKGGRGCVTGQGELKKKHFDPLFSLNHSCAMLRANINRLFRRTWCTTKDSKYLKDHLDIYMDFHNRVLLSL